MLLPVQLHAKLLKFLDGAAGKHHGISQMMQEVRRKNYFPSKAKYLRNWVQQCETCTKDKRNKNTKLRPELRDVLEWNMGPGDAMQRDFFPELPPSADFENIVTAIYVFSRYKFYNPVSTPRAVNPAKVIIDIMTEHANLPTLKITDKGSVFISQVIHEVAAVLGITLKHATTKHAKLIGILERKQATIKTSLKRESSEYRNIGTNTYH